jgi:hypothetical protein
MEMEMVRARAGAPATPAVVAKERDGAQRQRVGKRRMHEQLVRDLTAHGDVAEPTTLAARVVQQALSGGGVGNNVDAEMTPRRVHVVRYRRRVRRRAPALRASPLTHVQLSSLLQPRDDAEKSVGRRAGSGGHAMLAVARHRQQQLRGHDAHLRAKLRELEPHVVEWLNTRDGAKLELVTGSLRAVSRAVRARPAARVTDAAIVRVSAALLAERQPVALVQRVQASMRQLGDKRARVR